MAPNKDSDLPEGAMRQEDIDKVRVPGNRSQWVRLDFRHFIKQPDEDDAGLEKRLLAEAEEACFDYPRIGWSTDIEMPKTPRPRSLYEPTDEELEGIFDIQGRKFNLKELPLGIKEPRKHKSRYIMVDDNIDVHKFSSNFREVYSNAYLLSHTYLGQNGAILLGEVRKKAMRKGYISVPHRSRNLHRLEVRVPELVRIRWGVQTHAGSAPEYIGRFITTVFHDQENSRSICQMRVSDDNHENLVSKIDVFYHINAFTIKHVPVLEYVR